MSPVKLDWHSYKKSATKRINSDNCLACTLINLLRKDAMIAEICKYVHYNDSIPNLQEDQLQFLMDKFNLQKLKQAYLITLGKI